ncbi:uncharacterized protein B0H18DRAFT_1122706 [Fomitopsis serialis]|uniref:uncharacterized protein n=1 Tax=Fomitopsis serialis TaxID=139415 RepID=UPI002008508B|nr:uncharacterized protein B0H18DRAFT_1122706 [Neoantrodia serialis]KAH9919008.1 hypothetical protein B0H18DRAFT_1122706 [Neoantrodia serialis]
MPLYGQVPYDGGPQQPRAQQIPGGLALQRNLPAPHPSRNWLQAQPPDPHRDAFPFAPRPTFERVPDVPDLNAGNAFDFGGANAGNVPGANALNFDGANAFNFDAADAPNLDGANAFHPNGAANVFNFDAANVPNFEAANVFHPNAANILNFDQRGVFDAQPPMDAARWPVPVPANNARGSAGDLRAPSVRPENAFDFAPKPSHNAVLPPGHIRLPAPPIAAPYRPGPMRDVRTNGFAGPRQDPVQAVQREAGHPANPVREDPPGPLVPERAPMVPPATPAAARRATPKSASSSRGSTTSQQAQPKTPATPSKATESTKRGGKASGKRTASQTPASSKAKQPAKRGGLGSKGGEGNRREHGTSDEEIAELSQAQREAAALKKGDAEADEDSTDLDDEDSDEEGAEGGGGKKRGLSEAQKHKNIDRT